MKITNIIRFAAAVMLAECAFVLPAHAQSQADSVATWTQAVTSGSLLEKAEGVAQLARIPVANLPAQTRLVLTNELNRIGQLLDNGGVPGAETLGEEGLGEYYLDLAMTVAQLPGESAQRALIHAIDAGLGFQRRVARLGDAIVPELARMAEAGNTRAEALETMALAWYWADSTGAALSDASRQTILLALLAAPESDDYGVRRSAPEAFAMLGNPIFLPVAEAALAGALARDEELVAGALEAEVIPFLRGRVGQRTPAQQGAELQRAVGLLCAGVTSGPRNGACTSLTNELATGIRHLDAQRTQPARNVLTAVARNMDGFRDRGVFDSFEHALIAGGVRNLLTRL
jgi:hypothetical protein